MEKIAAIKTDKENLSPYQKAKRYRATRLSLKGYIRDFILISIGVFSAAFGLKGFLLTNSFIDGGATGVSLLTSALTGIPVYFLIIIVNIPFMIMGYKTLGKNFAIKTVLAITGLALVVANISF